MLTTRINESLSTDGFVLKPIYAPASDDKERPVVAYELRELGVAGRRNIGRISVSFVRQLARMHPKKMVLALDIKAR